MIKEGLLNKRSLDLKIRIENSQLPLMAKSKTKK